MTHARTVTAVAIALLAAAAAGPAGAEPVRCTIDPTHTTVHLAWRPEGLATLRVRLGRAGGAITLDRAARRGEAEVVVDLAGVSSGIAALDDALRAPQALDAAREPQARFVAAAFMLGDAGAPLAVPGRLALRGRGAALVLQAPQWRCYRNLLLGREVCGGDFDAELRPADWGLDAAALPGAPAVLRLLVQVEAVCGA